MNLREKRVLIIGAARSGIATAEFLQANGAKVILNDLKTIDQIYDTVNHLNKLGVELYLGEPFDISSQEIDFLVVSPGVPTTNNIITKALSLNIPVISEIELASKFCHAPIVSITGTNGKTTTTALTGQIFLDARKHTLIGGNIGSPFIGQVNNITKESVVVLELSSFQLETCQSFRPKVAAILNITPDHLDRHLTMENYVSAKSNIFVNQQSEDYLILNYDDSIVAELANEAKSHVLFFSRKHSLESGIYVSYDRLVIKWLGKIYDICSTNEIYIKGSHNLENAMVAALAAFVLGISPESIRETLRTFPGVSHRLEFVAKIDGITYINDSKGTNPDASIKALEAYNKPLILIAGGKSKGSDFTLFAEKIKEAVKKVVLIGEAAGEIKTALDKVGYFSYIEAKSMANAITISTNEAETGEIILLSPACASFDMFKNFEERGEVFKDLVLSMRR